MIEKNGPHGCGARALKANSDNQPALYGAFASKSQAETYCPRISARAFNRLRDVEERIALLDRTVSTGEANRSLVVSRLIAAIVNAGLDEEGPR